MSTDPLTPPDSTRDVIALPSVELTKWPRLLVAGDPVTEEQANEILIRTAEWSFMATNDKAWERAVYSAAGIALNDRHGWPDHDSVAAFEERHRVISLNYLGNSRIMSAWIGGPHGWCDWDGRIGCTSHNIGKWPSVEEVHDDLVKIAAAFPYLTMRVQLVPDEGAAGRAAVEWRVQDGLAKVNEPSGLITEPTELSEGAFLAVFSSAPGRERGVSLMRLTHALRQVAESA
ncbi:MAG: hypothetical protein AVDCRST_MAG83-1226 [uncultured Arthrobacter sp.]|uniref:Uncharacterized protein n=1 Tax=uncultured Arthrobacter sp. TaxID=114050 RepID=A0A6J4HWT3_9MICC|nr:hypothetical protein [uncultured Arthrobacter sp.]CAA9234089.1 MAG: hypothetical protein AVDCRST_MAG83-1226 [uncultured Arthrobacter sp.]